MSTEHPSFVTQEFRLQGLLGGFGAGNCPEHEDGCAACILEAWPWGTGLKDSLTSVSSLLRRKTWKAQERRAWAAQRVSAWGGREEASGRGGSEQEGAL